MAIGIGSKVSLIGVSNTYAPPRGPGTYGPGTVFTNPGPWPFGPMGSPDNADVIQTPDPSILFVAVQWFGGGNRGYYAVIALEEITE